MLDAQIADRDRGGEDTLISRGQAMIACGRLPIDGLALRNNLLGLLIGLVPTTAKAAAMALDHLTLDASRAALLRAALPDPLRFAGLVREAMRLNPINPGLLRVARRDARVPGSDALIREGATVFAATISAMRDPKFVSDPMAMDPYRPASVYLNNGFGLHACFGWYVIDANVTQLLRTLLEAGYARTPGAEGDLGFEGPFPARMLLTRG
jgi:cytochrome P450